jgi:hypothetical protein
MLRTDMMRVLSTYLRENFPKLSDAELKEGIFIGLQIREIIDDLSEHLLTEAEKSA